MDRGMIGRLRRPPSLDMESYQELVTGLRKWVNGPFRQAASDEVDAMFGDRMLQPGEDRTEVRRAIAANPLVGARDRVWASVQQMTWKNVIDTLWKDADTYLDELDAADASGPGTLTLNPQLQIPDYARHEIHLQPGGYVGDDLGGYVYYWGTNNFYEGQVYQDDHHRNLARTVDRPADGVVRKMVDLGCGIGRVTLALKDQFPEAEVHGVDYGAALLRFAHKRAIDLNIEVHFSQQLAEDLNFEDNSFDIVTSYIMFHEVPSSVAERVFKEAYRILRPGGSFQFFDFRTGAKPQTPYNDHGRWVDHVYNGEVWTPQYIASDPLKSMADIGFEVEEAGPRHWAVFSYKGIKPQSAAAPSSADAVKTLVGHDS